jgi:hypothetical protein
MTTDFMGYLWLRIAPEWGVQAVAWGLRGAGEDTTPGSRLAVRWLAVQLGRCRAGVVIARRSHRPNPC